MGKRLESLNALGAKGKAPRRTTAEMPANCTSPARATPATDGRVLANYLHEWISAYAFLARK